MLTGKGMYIWQVTACEVGDPLKIALTAQAAGLNHVLVKIADGGDGYNDALVGGVDQATAVVSALQRAGVQCWGWGYVYGDYPVAEADTAARRVRETGVTGYVIDAEGEYKRAGRAAAAVAYCDRLRKALPGVTLALSSYRYPSLHPELPWREFLSRVDYNIPQVYWMYASNPGAQLRRCVAEFTALPVRRPIIPTGAAWRQGTWSVTPAQAVEFLATAKSLGLAGANFWDWQHARSQLPAVWEAIASLDYGPEPVPLPEQEPELETGDGAPLEVLVKTTVNLRSSPSAANSRNIIGSLRPGDVETVISLDGSTVWVQVAETDDHPAGWSAFRWSGSRFMEIV